MKILYPFVANIVFLFHIILVFIILFGFLFGSIYLFYLSLLIIVFLFELVLGHCPLTKPEFYFRRKIDPALDYDSSFLSYYGHKFVEGKISYNLIRYSALFFLSLAIILNLLLNGLELPGNSG